MDDIPPQLLLLALLPLLGFLLFMEAKRERRRAAERTARRLAISQDGQPLDLAPLQKRIETVKANYIGVRQHHPAEVNARRDLLARARAKLGRLAFFQHSATLAESEPHAH